MRDCLHESDVTIYLTYCTVAVEICLLTKTKRVASVRADTYCSLFSLSVEHLDQVLDRYPQVRQTLEEVSAERLRQLRDTHCVAGPSISSKQRRQLRRMVRAESIAPHTPRSMYGGSPSAATHD